MKKKISIIVPIFNAEKWIGKCLESIINQTYKDLEIILINDGSLDKSLNICNGYKEKDSRIIVINKKNEGVSVARNEGLKVSSGEYIKFVDSDDWLEKNACELLVESIEKNNADLVMCGLTIYKEDKVLRMPHLNNKVMNLKENINNFEYINKLLASPCNKLYKKEKIKKNYKIDLSTGEDLLFNIEYLKDIDIIVSIEQCLYNVCLDNDTSLNRKFRNDRLDIALNLLEKQKEFCYEAYGENCNIEFLYNLYLLQFHAYLLNIQKFYDKKENKRKIKSYLQDKRITEACRYAKLKRIDYKIFQILVKLKIISLLYCYFKLKSKIVK